MTDDHLKQLADLIEAAHFAPDDDAYLAIVVDNLLALVQEQQKQTALLKSLVEGQGQMPKLAAASAHQPSMSDDGLAHAVPDWDALAQPEPECVFDQQVQWYLLSSLRSRDGAQAPARSAPTVGKSTFAAPGSLVGTAVFYPSPRLVPPRTPSPVLS